MPQMDEQRAVPGICTAGEPNCVASDVDEPSSAGFDPEYRCRNDLGRYRRDRRQLAVGGRADAAAAYHDRFKISFCNVPIISTMRRQTFSMKFMTLLRSASLGNCR